VTLCRVVSQHFLKLRKKDSENLRLQGIMRSNMKRSLWGSLVVVAVVLAVVLSAANLWLGNLNQDEGWYLYAAKQITEGRVLYRDFMFTQGPALPYVYGVLFPVIGKLGVAGGRVITALFGLAAAGCAAWLAGRAVPSKYCAATRLCAFALIGINVYQSYFTTIVKTYGLCSFFLAAGFVALSYANGRRGASGAFWGGFLLALAAVTRLSAGIALPIAGLWLVWNRRKVFPFGKNLVEGQTSESQKFVSHPTSHIPPFTNFPAWLAFGLGGGFVLLVTLGTFFWLAPENTQFALFGYHAGRLPGGLMELAALKAGFISRFVQAYFLFAGGCVLAFIFRRHHRHIRERELNQPGPDSRPRLSELLRQANEEETPFAYSFISLLWLAGAAITLVHFLAPFPYDDYQAIVYPLLAAALTATLIRRLPEKHLPKTTVAVLLLCTASAFSSPINQEWLIRGRDRIWWKFKEKTDLAVLRETGAQIREMLGEDDLLLTQDTYLAIEARAQVPHGLEMGPFSYYPDMPREQAEKLNLINRPMMIDLLLSAPAPVAAFSGYGLTIASPEIAELSSGDLKKLRTALEASYQKTAEVPAFGQAHTTLEIFRRIPHLESRISNHETFHRHSGS